MLDSLIIVGICFSIIIFLNWKQPNLIAPIYAMRILSAIGCLAVLSTLCILLFWKTIDPIRSLTNREAAIQFLSTFLICTLTNIDNLAMFLSLFELFELDREDETRVLKIVLMGRAIIRMVLLTMGILLIQKARWVVRLLSLPLLYTGYNLAIEDHKSARGLQKVVHKLRVKGLTIKGRSRTGPLALTLLLISDTFLGIDSTAATLAFTNNILIAQTANLLALAMQVPFYVLLKRAQERSPQVKRILGILLLCIGLHILAFG
ncbi:TerC family protein [Candidatus Similichlamydia laticola]|uniref:Integral membrane protein TerC n=1 Tax=Candidatus Similichlamydia laticola TaxID=2170265 RepID=A0A369KAI9_9BACT|nr:hypothetical protein [Candidatus Similichlamydia laticola]RDB31619.1 Integral membrane protein TerC [Candidatus Similichlamydia laticola]